MADVKRDPDVHTPPWLDKSLWLAVLGFLLPLLNKKLGLDLSPTEMADAILPLVGFITMSKWKQTRVVEAKTEADSAAVKEIADLKAALAELKGVKP